eukprot:3894556-Prymnesium_polylepis.1
MSCCVRRCSRACFSALSMAAHVLDDSEGASERASERGGELSIWNATCASQHGGSCCARIHVAYDAPGAEIRKFIDTT